MTRRLFAITAALLVTLPIACGGASFSGVPLDVRIVFAEDGDSGDLVQVAAVVSSVELVPCTEGGLAVVLDALSVPRAQAHVASTPTLLGAPHVIELAPGSTTSMGTLEPPPGCYASVRITLAPADADAIGLASVPQAIGSSLVARWSDGTEGATTMHAELVAALPPGTRVSAGETTTLEIALFADLSSAQPAAGYDRAVSVLSSLYAEASLGR